MTIQLSPSELEAAQSLLKDYAPAQTAIANLSQNSGDLNASFADLIVAEAGTALYDGAERESLRDVFLRNLRREICGDDSFREKVETYNNNPGKAELLTGLIVYLVGLVQLPINPAIATIAVLWVLKLGLRTFCEYTEPASE